MLLALREIRRAKVRYALLTGAIALLVFLILFMQVLSDSLISGFIGAIKHQSGNVLVYGADARKNLEGSVVTDTQVQQVRAVVGARGTAAPLGEATFTVEPGGNRALTDAVIFGYSLGGPGAPTQLARGRLPTADGEGVASDSSASQGFGIGDTITVRGPGTATSTVRIVGLTRNSRFSVLPTIFASYATWEAAAAVRNPGSPPRPASAVAVTVTDPSAAAAVARDINKEVTGVDALTRSDAVAQTPGVASVSQSIGLIIGIALLAVFVVSGLFFVILVRQKTPSLTLLRAIGAKAGYLVRGLLFQVSLVVVGGILIGGLIVAVIPSTPQLPIELTVGLVATFGAVILIASMIASAVAILRVLRIDPIRATTGPGGLL